MCNDWVHDVFIFYAVLSTGCWLANRHILPEKVAELERLLHEKSVELYQLRLKYEPAKKSNTESPWG